MNSMIIDAHQHFWQYDPCRHRWITDAMAVLKRDFLPADLAPQLLQNHVDGTVAVQAETSLRETEFLLNLAARSERIAGVVGWIDLASATIAEQLQSFKGRGKLCGFRHVVQDEPDDLRPYLDLVVEAFTPSRLMFGSDWPVCLLAGEYRAVKNSIEAYAQHLWQADRDLIFGGVAAQFYGLKDVAP